MGVTPRLGGGSRISPGDARGRGVPRGSQTSAEGCTESARPQRLATSVPAARRRPLLPLQVCAGRNVESAQLALLGEGSAAPSSLRASSARRPSSSLLHPRWKETPLPDSSLQRGPLALARRATPASPLLPRRPGSACAATPGGHKVPGEPRSPYLPLLWAPLWNDGNDSGRPQTWSRAVCPKDRSRGDTVSSSRFFDRLLRWPRARPFLHTPPGVTAWGLTLHHLLFL